MSGCCTTNMYMTTSKQMTPNYHKCLTKTDEYLGKSKHAAIQFYKFLHILYFNLDYVRNETDPIINTTYSYL